MVGNVRLARNTLAERNTSRAMRLLETGYNGVSGREKDDRPNRVKRHENTLKGIECENNYKPTSCVERIFLEVENGQR